MDKESRRLRRSKWVLLLFAVTLFLGAAYLYASGRMNIGPPLPREDTIHALYVWQRVWTDDVRASVAESVKHTSHLMVLAHEEGTPPVDVDWQALAATRLPVTPVFRYSKSLQAEIEAEPMKAAQRVSDTVSTLCDSLDSRGVSVAGVQLDYDAPTSSLENYGKFLRHLQPILLSIAPISITALPTWLDTPAFSDIASTLDYYVLQVHSFERPGSIETPLVLCDTTKIPGYIAQAERIGASYFIAFPTHGYEAAFDSTGAFVGLSAEGPDPAWPGGVRLREVRSEPAAIAGAIHALAADMPTLFRGVIWFRMPVATDTRNWTWPVLSAVMQGRVPSALFRTEVRLPDPSLAEIWLSSIGEDKSAREIEVRLALPSASLLASDMLNNFQLTSGAREGDVILKGMSPVGEEPIMIGWFRMRDEAGARGIKVLETEPSKWSSQGSEAG